MANAVDKAYDAIREGIRTGAFAAGSHLKEEDLAERIGVSRTPIREALRRLNAEGAVRFMRNQGAFVASWSPGDVRDIFELRGLLEGFAAEKAALRGTPEQQAALRRLAETMVALERDRPDDVLARVAEANAAFHRLIIEMAGSQRLTAMMAHVVEIPLVLRTFHRYSSDALRRSLGHHLEIVAALEARDPVWAASVMRSHISAAWHAIEVQDALPQAAE